ATLLFYEAPHRLAEMLETLEAVLGGARPVVVCFNLTKEYQWFLRGTLAEARARVASLEKVLGEVTIVVGGATAMAEETWPRAEAVMRAMIARDIEPRMVRDVVAEAFSLSKRDVYQRVLALARVAGD